MKVWCDLSIKSEGRRSDRGPVEAVRFVMNMTACTILSMLSFLQTTLTIANIPLFFQSSQQSVQFMWEMLAVVGKQTVGWVPLPHELQNFLHCMTLHFFFLELHHSLFMDQKTSACFMCLGGVLMSGEWEEGVLETPELAIIVGFIGSDGEPPMTDWHAWN